MRWIFLDDERMPPSKPVRPELNPDPVIVRSYGEFVEEITRNGLPGFITFDHDLGDGPTGFDCAKWLIEWVMDDPSRWSENFVWDIHSQNPIGAANIQGLLSQFVEIMKAG